MEVFMTIDAAYSLLYESALIVLAVLIGAMLIRSIMGPAVTDRVLAITCPCILKRITCSM